MYQKSNIKKSNKQLINTTFEISIIENHFYSKKQNLPTNLKKTFRPWVFLDLEVTRHPQVSYRGSSSQNQASGIPISNGVRTNGKPNQCPSFLTASLVIMSPVLFIIYYLHNLL